MTSRMRETIRKRVAKGAALLDEKRPGWARRVRLTELEMESCRYCVLGQVFGEYSNGLRALDIAFNSQQDFKLGFDSPGDLLYRPPALEAYDALRADWSEQIRSRRKRVAA